MFGNKIRCSQRRPRGGTRGEAMADAPPEVAQARPALHSRWLSAALAVVCALVAMAEQPHAQAVAQVNKAIDSAEARRRLEQEAIVSEKMSPAQFTRFVESEIAKWGPLARAAISSQGSGN